MTLEEFSAILGMEYITKHNGYYEKLAKSGNENNEAFVRAVRNLDTQVKYLHSLVDANPEALNDGSISDEIDRLDEAFENVLVALVNIEFSYDENLEDVDAEQDNVAEYINQIITLCDQRDTNRLKLIEAYRKGDVLDLSQPIYFPDEKFDLSYKMKKEEVTNLYPAGHPRMEDVKQKEDLACFLLAPLASIAAKNPDIIQNMLEETKDGKRVNVKFYGMLDGKKTPFTIQVDKTTLGLDPDSAPWVQIIEKAFAASGLRMNRGDIRPNTKAKDRSINLGVALDGASADLTITSICNLDDNIDTMKESKMLKGAQSVGDACGIFCERMYKACREGHILYMDTADHVVAIKDIKKNGYNYTIQFYNQESGQGIQTASLEQLFYGNVNVFGKPILSMQVCPVNKNQIMDRQIISLVGLRQYFKDLAAGKIPEKERQEYKETYKAEMTKDGYLYDFIDSDERTVNEKKDEEGEKQKVEELQNQGEVVDEQSFVTKNVFKAFRDELRAARTFFNSDEYDLLIDAVEAVNKSNKLSEAENLSDKKNYIVKMFGLKSYINNYLDHKAKDGVNQNVFKKLAAVEKLNAYVSAELLKYKDEPEFVINANSKKPIPVNPGKFTITLKQEADKYLKNHNAADIESLTEIRGTDVGKELYESAHKVYTKVSEEDYMNVDTCMCRIIMRAKNKKSKNLNEIEHMREQFQNHPANDVEKNIVVEQPQNNVLNP